MLHQIYMYICLGAHIYICICKKVETFLRSQCLLSLLLLFYQMLEETETENKWVEWDLQQQRQQTLATEKCFHIFTYTNIYMSPQTNVHEYLISVRSTFEYNNTHTNLHDTKKYIRQLHKLITFAMSLTKKLSK